MVAVVDGTEGRGTWLLNASAIVEEDHCPGEGGKVISLIMSGGQSYAWRCKVKNDASVV